MTEIGKLLLLAGLILMVVGGIFVYFPNIDFPRLPGDIYIKRDNFTFYFPWVTTLIISLVLTIIVNLINRR